MPLPRKSGWNGVDPGWTGKTARHHVVESQSFASERETRPNAGQCAQIAAFETGNGPQIP